MADLAARCDWYGDELHIILPELPKRIEVMLSDERGREAYSAKMHPYITEENALLREEREVENAKLRELIDVMDKIFVTVVKCTNVPCAECPAASLCEQMVDMKRELGIEVEVDK